MGCGSVQSPEMRGEMDMEMNTMSRKSGAVETMDEREIALIRLREELVADAEQGNAEYWRCAMPIWYARSAGEVELVGV